MILYSDNQVSLVIKILNIKNVNVFAFFFLLYK
jgi:hypothetical protein